VTPADNPSRLAVAKMVDLVSMGQLDLALLQVATAIPHRSTVSLPEITARSNAQLGGVTVETFGRGISQLAGVVNGVWQPSKSDGIYRRGVFQATHAMSGSVDLAMPPGGAAIAGGDSGGPSYIKIWKDPSNHASGTYREIVGVASNCDAVRPDKFRDTKGWTWVSRVTKCWIATPGPIRAHIAEVIAEASPNQGVGGGILVPTTPTSVVSGRNRALYVVSLDRPLVPAAPVEHNKPLLFTQCQADVSLMQAHKAGCPYVAGYDVWHYEAQTEHLRYSPTGWCLAPVTLDNGANLVLVSCRAMDRSQSWRVLPMIPGSDRWKEIRNQQSQLCATAEYPPGAGQAVRPTARLVARPCNGSKAQIFDTTDSETARNLGPR
jgi:hypothetical protein